MSSHNAADEFRSLQEVALAKSGVSAESRIVDIPGMQIHLLESGAGDPVVMIGGNAPAMLWAPLAALLAPRYHLYMPDRPGTGLSTAFNFRGVDLRTHGVVFLRAILEALGLERVVLAGNSMGGFFAMAFAAGPDRPMIRFYQLVGTRGLNAVLQATVLRPPNNGAEARAGLKRSRIVADPDGVSDDFLEAFAASARLPGVARGFRTMVERVLDPPGTGLFGRPTKATHALIPELGKLTSPTLFLWGDKDPLGTPEVGRMLVSKMPHAQLQVVENAGHVPWVDQPEFCAEAMTAFLAGK